MTFPYACARLREHFLPLGFEAVLDSPLSMTARVFDTKTGENFAVVAGLPWSTSPTDEDLLLIVDTLDEELKLHDFIHTPLNSGTRVGE